MPIEIGWYIEDRIILMKSSGHVTVDEIHAADEIGYHLLETSAATQPLIHILLEESEMTHNPGITPYTQTRSTKHPRLGWLVESGTLDNRLFVFLGNVTAQILRLRYKQVPTFDDSLVFLMRVDSTLPDLTQTPGNFPPSEGFTRFECQPEQAHPEKPD